MHIQGSKLTVRKALVLHTSEAYLITFIVHLHIPVYPNATRIESLISVIQQVHIVPLSMDSLAKVNHMFASKFESNIQILFY